MEFNNFLIMKKLTLWLVFLLLAAGMAAHPWKPAHYVIIDTDGGIDDMRAISLLLASPDVRVMGIITSGGVLSADKAWIKVRSMLNTFHHEGLPVGINRGSNAGAKAMPVPAAMIYGDERNLNPAAAEGHLELISRLLEHETAKISFIALGSLNTALSAYRNVAAFPGQVKEIVWSSHSLTDMTGFNYEADKTAAHDMMATAALIRIVNAPTAPFYSDALISALQYCDTRYGRMIASTLSGAATDPHEFAFRATDEMVALWLQFPELFTTEGTDKRTFHELADGAPVTEHFMKMIRGETVEPNQVIRAISTDPEFYFEDMQPYVTEIIERHGMDEWTAAILGSELHRHLGVFNIVGVKMGIRAREYFNTGVDEFFTTSFAGTEQPLSCMIDGLLVSTGSTPGHALLKVVESDNPSPSATFTYKDVTIKMTLKPEIAQKIAAELKEYNFVYGLDSNIYWELVRKSTCKYWRDFDRHEIFIIEDVSNSVSKK